jgi:hypothetical protein
VTELEKFKQRAKRTGLIQVSGYHAKRDWEGMTEEYAKAMNDVDKWLEDPVNDLISRLGGDAFRFRENAAQKYQLTDTGAVPIPLTYDQKADARTYALIEEAIKMLENLNEKVNVNLAASVGSV